MHRLAGNKKHPDESRIVAILVMMKLLIESGAQNVFLQHLRRKKVLGGRIYFLAFSLGRLNQRCVTFRSDLFRTRCSPPERIDPSHRHLLVIARDITGNPYAPRKEDVYKDRRAMSGARTQPKEGAAQSKIRDVSQILFRFHACRSARTAGPCVAKWSSGTNFLPGVLHLGAPIFGSLACSWSEPGYQNYGSGRT